MDDYDIVAQGLELEQKRKLVEALRAKVTGPASYDTMFARMKADRLEKDLPSQTSEYQKRYSGQLRGEMENYLNTTEGRKGEVLNDGTAAALMSDNVNPQLADPIKADPRKAVLDALTSRLPEMQAMGKAGLKPRETKEHIIDNKLIRSDGLTTPTVAGDYGTPKQKDKYGPIEVVGKDAQGRPIQGQRNLETGKIEPIGNSGQTINVGGPVIKGQNAGFEAWAKEAVNTVKEVSGMARSSVKMLGQLQQVEKLSDAGTFGGPTANTAVWLGQLFKAGGLPLSNDAAKRLSNSETFGNTAAELWLQTMNANGGSRGLVKEESERIAANLPALVQTPAGRKQMIAVMRQAAQQNVEDAQRANIELSNALQTQDPAKFTFGLTNVNLPNTMPMEPAPGSVAGQPPGAMSFDDYLKKLRGGR